MDKQAQEDTLRSEIKAIVRNCALTEHEKSAEIQKLMNPGRCHIRTMGEQAEPTYHDKEQQILGCPHYQVKAKVLAQCCSVWVPCRFCHNDMQDHSMDRFAVEQMKCMLCLEEQPLGQQCQKCKATMARYFCIKCRLLDDGPGKKVFHCDQCGICRSGSSEEFFHCKGCDACVATEYRDSHGCREHILHVDCPICGEDLSDSTQTIVQIACEHLIHESCLQQNLKYSYKCPLCSASLCNMDALFGAIERYLQVSSMPHKYQNRTSRIFCNDCRQRSAAKFHFMYHKCGQCSSFNTVVVGVSSPASPA
ncbi:zinc-ribbon-domain-containing protein [Coemansia mojavensis]|nr:zinc-ribbon-domain-containing protein [Coemansia mojavensis]